MHSSSDQMLVDPVADMKPAALVQLFVQHRRRAIPDPTSRRHRPKCAASD
jgi:hypothetical protein